MVHRGPSRSGFCGHAFFLHFLPETGVIRKRWTGKLFGHPDKKAEASQKLAQTNAKRQKAPKCFKTLVFSGILRPAEGFSSAASRGEESEKTPFGKHNLELLNVVLCENLVDVSAPKKKI